MKRILRALASAVGLVVAIAGLPALLVGVVGWPLPHGLPAGSEIRGALGDGWRPGERFVLGVLAVVVWVLWAQLLRHLVVEVRLHRRAGSAPRVVTVASSRQPGPSRRLAGWLVGGLMVVGPLSSVAVAATPRIPVVLTATRALDAPSTAPAAPPAVTAATPVPSQSYVVHTWEEDRDCLWTIAERFLGDPLRWGEVLELNADLRQPGGRRLGDDPRHWVYPGMQLRLPAGAVGEGVSAATPAQALVSNATTPDLATASSAADAAQQAAPFHQQTGAPAPIGLPVPAALPGPMAGRASSNGSGRAVPTTVAPPTLPAAAPSSPADQRTAPATVEGASGGIRVNGRNLLGAGLLAAGVVATLDRMRRAQMRRRLPGQRIPLPGPDTAGREWAARVGADPEAMELVDLGLRAMAAGLDDGDEPPEILGVELAGGRLEVVLASPAPAPAGFAADDVDGSRWVLVADSEAELGRTSEAPQPLPALVTLGHSDAGSQILVDLEQARLTAIAGDPEVAREMVWAAAAELANKHEATLFSLVLVGFGDGLAGLERVETFDTLDGAFRRLKGAATGFGRDLVEHGWRSLLHARVATAMPDCWAPTVVLCAEPLLPADLARLVSLTTSPTMAGVVALVAGEVAAASWQLSVVGGLLDVPPLGLRLSPQRLSAEEAAAVDELYATGRLHPLPQPDLLSFPMVDRSMNGWASTPAPLEEADDPADEFVPEDVEEVGPGPGDVGSAPEPSGGRPRVLVRVLGPPAIEIEGVTVAFERAKAIEAIAYLETHRDVPVDGDRLGEALFPSCDGRPTRRLNTVMWAARKGLGAEKDGDSVYLPKLRGSERCYGMKETDLDYDLVVEASKLAAAHHPGARQALRDALEAVRGTPFDPGPTKGNARNRKALDREGFQWAHVDRLIYEMSAGVADAAHLLFELCFRDGDLEGARSAAAQGLKASPHHEVLCRDQMLVADASGNVAGVDAVWSELCAWMDEDQPCDSLDPETVDLYHRLRR